MSVAAGLYVVGTVYNMYQQGEADRDQAAAEERNAAFFMEQAAFARRAGEREQAIFSRQTDQFIDAQMGRVAKSGVNFSGQTASVVAFSEYLAGLELQAIKDETEFNVRLATMRGIDSLQVANDIRSGTKAKQVGMLLNGIGNAASMSSKSGNEKKRRSRSISPMPTEGEYDPDGGYSGITSNKA